MTKKKVPFMPQVATWWKEVSGSTYRIHFLLQAERSSIYLPMSEPLKGGRNGTLRTAICGSDLEGELAFRAKLRSQGRLNELSSLILRFRDNWAIPGDKITTAGARLRLSGVVIVKGEVRRPDDPEFGEKLDMLIEIPKIKMISVLPAHEFPQLPQVDSDILQGEITPPESFSPWYIQQL